MTHAFLPFDHFNRYDSLTFRIKNLANNYLSFVHSLISKFNIKFNTGIIRRLQKSINKDLTSMLILLEGLNTHISKTEDFVYSEKEYKKFEEVFQVFRIGYKKLSNQAFFRNDETKKIADSIISELFEIDFKMRDIVYANTQVEHSESDILQYYSDMSLKSALSLAE